VNTDSDHIKDGRGIPVPIGPYHRVVSLVPSLTETVCGLGQRERLVGRTIYCCEPRGTIESVPAFGGTKNPNVAKIIELQPDLVLACVEENKPEHLKDLYDAGIAVFAVMPRSLDDVATLLSDYGVLLDAGLESGRALSDLSAARLTAGVFRAQQSRTLRAATLIWKDPWMAAGGGNHINAVLLELGLENVLVQKPDYFEISLEDLAQRKLDLIFLPDEPYRFTHHDSWSMAAAGVVPSRTDAILLDGKLLTWYGTRTAPGLRALIKLLKKIKGDTQP
jgi:ABC-type Fe3+-hydroxamate transport system substrate-binding protein